MDTLMAQEKKFQKNEMGSLLAQFVNRSVTHTGILMVLRKKKLKSLLRSPRGTQTTNENHYHAAVIH